MKNKQIKQARGDAVLYDRPAYILWLIRDHLANDWTQLCDHFGWRSEATHTGTRILARIVQSLKNAGFITVKNVTVKNVDDTNSWLDFLDDTNLWPDYQSASFEVTELVTAVQTTLRISLAELARHDPRDAMFVSSVFGKPFKKDYGRDVFVLMPFATALKPVYDDHIKPVAERLGMTVGRADDFFTEQSVIQEIWWAVVQSKILIGDCTGRNPNVFYEIGMAHTVGKPVILITQNEDDIPFDLRHRRFVTYQYTPPGMKQFEKHLAETLRTLAAELEVIPEITRST